MKAFKLATLFLMGLSAGSLSAQTLPVAGRVSVPAQSANCKISKNGGTCSVSFPAQTIPVVSAVSSHFFEGIVGTASYSGVSNPFQMVTGSPHCNLEALTFTQFTCNQIIIADDGSTAGNTPRNLTGTTLTMNAWGPGGFGGAEGRTTTMFGDSHNAIMDTPGIKQGYVSNWDAFGIGDVQFRNEIHTCNTGVAYQSDQGCQNYSWIGEYGWWNGLVRTGGTNTEPLTTYTGGCHSGQNQACAPSSGWVMTDKSVTLAAGNIISGCSATGPVSWISSCPTNAVLPIVTVWGTALGINTTTGTTWDSPLLVTFKIGAGGGTGTGAFAAGDHACVIGNKFHEQQIITSVSGSAGSQTITLPLAMPEDSIFIAKGDCTYISMDANEAGLMAYVVPGVSLDGSNFLGSFPAFSQMFPWLGPQHTSEFASQDGSADASFHVYAGARILRVDTTSPYYASFSDAYLRLKLEPNSAFADGDSIESTDFPAQKVDGLELTAIMQMPNSQLTGFRLHIAGPGVSGNSVLEHDYNDATVGNFQPWGGSFSEPAKNYVEGPFTSYLTGNYTPQTEVIGFNNHQPGQTGYTILRDPSWGTLTLDNTGTWTFTGASSLSIANHLYTGGGVDIAAGLTVGGNTSTYGSIDVRQDSAAANYIARFAGGKHNSPLGARHGGIALGETDAGSNSEIDKGALTLQDDGGDHRGIAVGVINSGTTFVPGFYMAPAEQGNGISIANGAVNCPTALCLGASTTVDNAGISTASISADRITTTNTDMAGFLTLSGGMATYTFKGNTNAAVCVATDNSAANPVKVSTTATTLTVTGTGADLISYICITVKS